MLPLSCIISIITKKINYLVRLDKNKIISVNHYRSVKTINVEHEMTEGLRNICTAYFCCVTDAANILFSLQYRVIIPHINNSTWKFGFKKSLKATILWSLVSIASVSHTSSVLISDILSFTCHIKLVSDIY